MMFCCDIWPRSHIFEGKAHLFKRCVMMSPSAKYHDSKIFKKDVCCVAYLVQSPIMQVIHSPNLVLLVIGPPQKPQNWRTRAGDGSTVLKELEMNVTSKSEASGAARPLRTSSLHSRYTFSSLQSPWMKCGHTAKDEVHTKTLSGKGWIYYGVPRQQYDVVAVWSVMVFTIAPEASIGEALRLFLNLQVMIWIQRLLVYHVKLELHCLYLVSYL